MRVRLIKTPLYKTWFPILPILQQIIQGSKMTKRTRGRWPMYNIYHWPCPCQGPSIKYVTLFFWPILTSFPLTHTLSHIPGLPKYVTHIGPPISSRPSTKNPDKKPLYKFSLNCSPGFCQRVFSLEGFVRGSFCPFPLPSEYICYYRKLTITLNFRFHM